MAQGDRIRVLRFAEAQMRIPSPAGEHAVRVLQRGADHQLEGLGKGFAVWRVFYGPHGGHAGLPTK
jgi:hypothetical protein